MLSLASSALSVSLSDSLVDGVFRSGRFESLGFAGVLLRARLLL